MGILSVENEIDNDDELMELYNYSVNVNLPSLMCNLTKLLQVYLVLNISVYLK